MPKLENFKKYILEIKWILASLIITFLGITILFIHTQIDVREELKIFLREFGVALIIAGVVSFVYEYFLRVGLVELIMEKHDIAKSITDAGIQGVYNPTAGRPRPDIEKNIPFFLDTATNKIKLLGITTDFYFRQGPGSPSYDKIVDLLDNKRCKIQILLLNPDPSQEEKTKGMEVPYSVLARAKAENDDPKNLQKKIRDSFNTKLKLKKKYLFSWDNVPGNDSEKLLRFLRDDFDIDWTENAEILKSNDGKSISILKDENSAEIIIDEKKEKATLKIGDGRTHDLTVKKENGKLNIYKKKYDDLLIKFYDSPPLCAMTILDRKMKVTPYLYGKLGLQSPTFELKNDEHGPIGLFGVYEKHFDLLWETGIERTEPYDI